MTTAHLTDLLYSQLSHSIGFPPESGAYHRDTEGQLSYSCGTPRDMTNHRYQARAGGGGLGGLEHPPLS